MWPTPTSRNSYILSQQRETLVHHLSFMLLYLSYFTSSSINKVAYIDKERLSFLPELCFGEIISSWVTFIHVIIFFENHKTSGHHETSVVFLSAVCAFCSSVWLFMFSSTDDLHFDIQLCLCWHFSLFVGMTFHPTHLFLVPLLNPSSLWRAPQSLCHLGIVDLECVFETPESVCSDGEAARWHVGDDPLLLER